MPSRLRVTMILGTRPEAIKLAPVVGELRRREATFDTRLVCTGQHRDLVGPMLQAFGLVPDIDLGVMAPRQSLAALSARLLTELDATLERLSPDLVVVQGDTTSAWIGALAAFYRGMPVGHVEAGLRTSDRRMPFPEELNRRLIAQVADLHFAPTDAAAAALRRECGPQAVVIRTGNSGIDALLQMRRIVADTPPPLPAGLAANSDGRRLVLVTMHRRESFGDGVQQVIRALQRLAEEFAERIQIVLCMHPNPAVAHPVRAALDGIPAIRLLEPQAYPQFVWLLSHAAIVLTDSGGIQEEAPALGKPVLVIRETTERSEGVEAGNAMLVGPNTEAILAATRRLLANPAALAAMSRPRLLFGDGQASRRIADAIETWWVDRQSRPATRQTAPRSRPYSGG